MIHEIDDALRRLIREEALHGSTVDVVFEAPTKDWAARRNAPTVNAYLYDIREDMRRRSRGLINEYDEQGAVRARTRPPRYVKLSYLLTAWTQRPEDEHRLLSALLLSFIALDAVPARLLTGAVAGTGMPVPMTTALPPPEDRAFADVWTALGGELKPSLDIVISAPLVAGPPISAGPPVRDGLQVELADRTGEAADERVGHRQPDGATSPADASARPAEDSARPAGEPARRPAMRRVRRP